MTKPIDFFQISPNECRKSYGEILANAERHFKVGKLLNREQEYGMAISHLVLGTEELVKAMIIYFDGIGLLIRKIKGVKRFFYGHKIRHIFSSMFIMMNYSINIVFYLDRAFRNGVIDENWDVQTWIEGDIDKNYGLSKRVFSELAFWDNADQLKLRGFYVDFANELLSPVMIEKIDFESAFKAVRNFRYRCLKSISYMEAISESERMKFVTTLNQKDDFYKTIEAIFKINS